MDQVKNNFSKKTGGPFDFLQLALPLIVTIIISIVGWNVSSSYNQSQLEISRSKNLADIEVAQANASFRYLELLNDMQNGNERYHAQCIVAPVLAPELSFQIAVGQINENPNMLRVLFDKYGNGSFKYIERYLEIEPTGYLKWGYYTYGPALADLIEPDLGEDELRARHLVDFLDDENRLNDLWQYLISDSYKRPHLRGIAFFYYFEHIEDTQPNVSFVDRRNEFLIKSIMADQALSDEIKREAALASCLVFCYGFDTQSNKVYLEVAAEYFWVNIEVSMGEVPGGHPLELSVYGDCFFYEYPPGTENKFPSSSLSKLSEQLWNELDKLNFNELSLDQRRITVYSYAESTPAVAPIFTSYLNPAHTILLLQKILISLDTEEERQYFSMVFGSLSGDNLYQKISQDDVSARKFIETIIDWYSQYHRDDWYIPDFFWSVHHEFPEYDSQIDWEGWGMSIPQS